MALSKVVLTNLALSKIGSDRLQITNFDTDTTVAGNQARLHYDQTLEELTRMHSWNCCKKRNELSPFKLKISLPIPLNSFSYIGTSTIPSGQSTQNTFTNYAQYDFNGGYAASVADSSEGGTISRVSTGSVIDTDVWRLKWYDGSVTYQVDISSLLFDPSNTYTHAAGNFVVEKVKPEFEYDYSYRILPDAERSFYVTDSSAVYNYIKPRVDWVREGNSILTNEPRLFLCYDAIPLPEDMDSLFAKTFYTMLAMKLAVPITGDRELEISLLEEINSVILPEARRVNGFERLEAPTLDSEWLEATVISPSSLSNSWPPFSQTSYGSFE